MSQHNVSIDRLREDMSTSRKTTLCMEWLEYCKSIGWTNDAMPDLADVFWKHEGWKTFQGFKG